VVVKVTTVSDEADASGASAAVWLNVSGMSVCPSAVKGPAPATSPSARA
jgi:hypothetical protein